MQTLTIRRNDGIEEIEKQYRYIGTWKNADAQVALYIPISLENNFMGLEPTLIQFVVTWIRYKNIDKLLLDVDNPEEEDWSKIFEAEHIYPIISLAINYPGVYNSYGTVPLNHFLREPFYNV